MSVRLWLASAVVMVCGGALALNSGCGGDGVNGGPLPVAQGGGGAASVTVGTGGGGAAPVKRTVIQRDPLGAIHKSKNLLWDGDFEWLSPFADQYGWLFGTTFQQITFAKPPVVIGAECRSGVKCARLGPGNVMLGLTVGWVGAPLRVSLWSAPEDGVCAGLEISLIDQSGGGNDSIPALAAEPDAQGWCEFGADVGERNRAMYLYVRNAGDAAILVDDIAIEPQEGAQAKSAALQPTTSLDPKTLAWLQAWGRAATEPRLPPPNEATKRLRAHMRRSWGK